jgi:hypothetical protein
MTRIRVLDPNGDILTVVDVPDLPEGYDPMNWADHYVTTQTRFDVIDWADGRTIVAVES